MVALNQIQIRDPFVLRQGSRYYLFGSTDKDIWRSPGVGFDVYRSQDGLTDFEGPFPAFRPPSGFWSKLNFWAPEVYQYAGAYYMFATFKPINGRRGTAVLRSAAVLGPYLPIGEPVTPGEWECLDGTLHTDQGVPWMVFCHEWQQVGDGQVCAMPLSDDLSHAIGEPQVLFTASQAPWSAPLQGRAPGSYVTDGPYVVRHPSGSLLIIWSSFGPQGQYCIGVARSASGSLVGPWQQEDQPLFESDGGHGMIFTDDEDHLWLAIHTPNQTPNERAIFVGVRFTDDSLAVTGETIA